jgi:fatty-acyl-CoA synthase
MKIDFSMVSENLANTFGDAECTVNVERNRRYTFREFHRLTNRIVNMMRSRLGLKRGDIWMNVLNNDNASLLSWFTSFKGDVCVCLTNTTDSLEIQEAQISLVKPKVVMIEAGLLPTHYALLKKFGLTIVSMDPPAKEFPDVLHFWDLLDGVSDENPHIVNDDRTDCLAIRFTGGTTGTPKAVMYSIDNWMTNKDLHFSTPDALPSQNLRFLHFGMISHASGMLHFPVLFRGGCTLTMNDRSMLTWCRTVEQEKITGALMVPSMLYRLLDAPEASKFDLSSLQLMIYGASPMMPVRLKQLRERFGDIFVQLYASSEHPGAVTCMSKADHSPLADGSEAHFASAGRVIPGADVMIADKNGKALPIGEDGEIWMRSRAICMGYLHQPEKTAAEFCDGYWKSGDFGRIDAHGFLYVLDRVKDTAVCNGRNVYPSQVEAVLSTHPNVLMAAVVGLPDDQCGEAVHAEVVLREGKSVEVSELLDFLAERLPTNDVPRTINFATSIPMSPVGKVLRRAVRDACTSAAASPAAV